MSRKPSHRRTAAVAAGTLALGFLGFSSSAAYGLPTVAPAPVEVTAADISIHTELTATVQGVDDKNLTVEIVGTGTAGATITVTTHGGAYTTVVDDAGEWAIVAPGLVDWENTVTVTQTIDGEETRTIKLYVVANPILVPLADPHLTGGAILLAAGIGATLLTVRRRDKAGARAGA
jgi:hypothetical protein